MPGRPLLYVLLSGILSRCTLEGSALQCLSFKREYLFLSSKCTLELVAPSFLKADSHIVHVDLHLLVVKTGLELLISCLYLRRAVVTGVSYHASFYVVLGTELRASYISQASTLPPETYPQLLAAPVCVTQEIRS